VHTEEKIYFRHSSLKILAFFVVLEHEIYTFVGYLVDPRFYDENGDPHRSLLAARERIAAAINTEQKVKKIR
jgi:hypothetical protein